MKDIDKAKQYLSAIGGDVYRIAGNGNREHRRHLMGLLTGSRLPLSKCGVNAIFEQVRTISGIHGGCHADQVERIRQWARR